MAVPVRAGATYEPPDYVEQWDNDYIATSGQSNDPKVIARLMEQGPADKIAMVEINSFDHKTGELVTRKVPADSPADSPAARVHAEAKTGPDGSAPKDDPGQGDRSTTPSGEPKPGGGNRGGSPPRGTGGGGAASSGPNPSRAYWDARKRMVPVDFHGDHVEPHEISFVEQFLATGEQMQWIPLDPQRRPSNDFIWTSNGGIQVEVKRTKAATYAAFHGRIIDSAARAAKQGVVKENFIADLADLELTDGLAAELAQFNVGRRQYRLKRLWVMTRGRLIEIDLEK